MKLIDIVDTRLSRADVVPPTLMSSLPRSCRPSLVK